MWRTRAGVALGLSLTFFVLVAFLFPRELRLSVSTSFHQLVAAIGSLDIVTLRLWQSAGGFSRDLVKGSLGSEVVLLQKILSLDERLEAVRATGNYGPKTTELVRGFQRNEGLRETGMFDERTRSLLNKMVLGQLCPQQKTGAADYFLAHVTRSSGLPSDYVPPGLVDISREVRATGIICLRQEAAAATKALVDAARADGVRLLVCSGYRGPQMQSYVRSLLLVSDGERALRYSAPPLHSEHQLGTTVDFTGPGVEYECASGYFHLTPENAWLEKNAWRYGFNLSYPKTHRSGAPQEYIYEPWHWRYVGEELAKILHEKGLSYIEWDLAPKASTTLSY